MKAGLFRTVKSFAKTMKKKVNHRKAAFFDRGQKVAVLVYHRVLPDNKLKYYHYGVSLKNFLRQIDGLARKYPVISMSEAAVGSEGLESKAGINIVLTFDDGYLEHYETVYPVLKKKGLRGLFFLPTGYIGGLRPIWDCELTEILYNSNIEKIVIAGKPIKRLPAETRCFFARRVIETLKSYDRLVIEEAIDSLDFCRRDDSYDLNGLMSWSQVKEMVVCGMEMGSHSAGHLSLARIPFSEAVKEIRTSKENVKFNTGVECAHFAFPFGSRKDYNQALIDCVKNEGFKTCSLNIHGYNRAERDAFCFKRIIMEESTDINSLLG